MRSDTNTLQDIPNGKPVRIFIPLKNEPERLRAQCLYQAEIHQKFTLIFKPGILPVDDIDIKLPCIVSIDMGGPTISLEAMIRDIANPQTLQMVVRKSISHKQMRDFFRVDATASVVSKAFRTNSVGDKHKQWTIQGHTVDISGSGILALFTEQPPADHQVRLEITLPSAEPDILTVLAHQVRSRQLKDGRFEVAYQFDEISTEDRDRMIGYCLTIQRQLLRLKVQVKESGV